MAHIIPLDLRNRTVEERFEKVRTHYEQAYRVKFKRIPKEADVDYLIWAYERLHLDRVNHFRDKPGLKEKYDHFREQLVTSPTATRRCLSSLEKSNDIVGSSGPVWRRP